MSVRFTGFDRARVLLTVDPEWLLAPLFARQIAGIPMSGPGIPEALTDPVPPAELRADPRAAVDWPRWWEAAVAFRPGGPPPRQSDLVAFSPALTRLWAAAMPEFDQWLASRPRAGAGTGTEAGIIAAVDDPAPVTVQVLQVPVRGTLLLRPERDRLVVSPAARGTDRYRAVLTELFAGRS